MSPTLLKTKLATKINEPKGFLPKSIFEHQLGHNDLQSGFNVLFGLINTINERRGMIDNFELHCVAK